MPNVNRAWIVTRRELLREKDTEGRYYIIGAFATRRSANITAKQHARKQAESIDGRIESHDKDAYACDIHPKDHDDEDDRFKVVVEVEEHGFEDSEVDEDEGGCTSEEEAAAAAMGEIDPDEWCEEGWDVSFERRRRKRLWSDVEDEGSSEDEDGSEDGDGSGDEGGGDDDLVILDPKAAREMGLLDGECELPVLKRPRFEP